MTWIPAIKWVGFCEDCRCEVTIACENCVTGYEPSYEIDCPNGCGEQIRVAVDGEVTVGE